MHPFFPINNGEFANGGRGGGYVANGGNTWGNLASGPTPNQKIFYKEDGTITLYDIDKDCWETHL